MRFPRLLIAFALVACAPACDSRPSSPVARDPVTPPPPAEDAAPLVSEEPLPTTPVPDTEARRLWTPAIADEEAFLAYSKELGGERFTKFVVDLNTDAIYYFDVDVFRVHKDFIFGELFRTPKTKEAVREFDKNYGPDKPGFLLCYLSHHLGPDVWTMAFWEGDKMNADHVRRAYARMKQTFFLGDKVKFRPDSTRQEGVAKQLGADVPVLTNDQLYKAADYQAFNPGVAIGTLRLVEAGVAFDELTFGREEIVILPESLPDITPVAGIISETFSTPLAHVSLRARAWGIPNIGLKAAAKTYEPLIGKTVWFEATDRGHTLREATAEEIAVHTAKASAARKVTIPKADLTQRALRTLDTLRASDDIAYGAKASNLGEIVFAQLDGFVVPQGFGVPIAFYDDHLRAAGLDQKIEAMLADDKFKSDPAVRKRELAALRAAIIDAPFDPALAAELATAISAITAGDAARGVFVRSSTNAEDLPGFNGAGLYDTVPNVKGAEQLATAMKTVWASVWNLRAYEERELFQIDHRRVYGAVLIQVGINATAAGVLVTAHPTDPQEKTTYQINAKSGLGMRVVEGKKVPESLLYDFKNDGLRVLSRSDEDTMLVFDDTGGVHEVPNPQKGQPILTNRRARNLGRAARAIVRVFPRGRPLDIEWLFEGEQLHIVQARPYVVR